MYGKIVALVVIMAAVALAGPMPQPNPVAQPDPNPGYYTPYGHMCQPIKDYLNPRSSFYNPYAANPYAGYNPYAPVLLASALPAPEPNPNPNPLVYSYSYGSIYPSDVSLSSYYSARTGLYSNYYNNPYSPYSSAYGYPGSDFYARSYAYAY
ncbi:hypothetical protein WDU94_001365 [Cyamophila willieti]